MPVLDAIVLNIAEGAGELSKDATTVIQPARDLLVRVVSMLVRLAST